MSVYLAIEEMIGSSKVQREYPKLIKALEKGELKKFATLRNNEVKAVTLSAQEYDQMLTYIEDLQDLITIYKQKDEPAVPLSVVLAENDL